MKTFIRCGVLFILFICLRLTTSQELSKRKCDEYSRKNEVDDNPNQYQKYMDKFVIAKTLFKEYDAVLISEEYALTSVAASNMLQFNTIIVNNITIDVANQQQQDGIYLLKLRYIVELYHKIVCLWHREELLDGYDFFTVTHEAGIRNIPFLRTYVPSIDCTIVQLESQRNRDNFCLTYENGRQSETAFNNPTASSLIFFKSFHNKEGLNKNHYIVGVLKQSDIIYGRKLWPNLKWIEKVAWSSEYMDPSPVDPECGQVVVPDGSKKLVSLSSPTYRGEFPWQVALFEIIYDNNNVRNEKYLCGGSLMNRDTILTAAHCVVNDKGEINQPARYLVKLGLYNLDGTAANPQIISVFRIIPHELYNDTSIDSDIAIIKLNNLATYSEFVRPICINDNIRAFRENVGTVAGWGRSENGSIPNTMRKGMLTIPSRSDCRYNSSDAVKDFLTEANYCASHKDGQNVCPGDSGSGMIMEYNGRWYVRGIVSYGGITNGLCNPAEYSLFTNTTYFYKWIMSNMQ